MTVKTKSNRSRGLTTEEIQIIDAVWAIDDVEESLAYQMQQDIDVHAEEAAAYAWEIEAYEMQVEEELFEANAE